MKNFKYIWVLGILVTLAIIIVPILILMPKNAKAQDSPWENVPIHKPHTDHSQIVKGPFETGADVTKACLECHEDAAFSVMQTSHWTWESQPFDVPWRDEPVTIGKKNQINNFCIGTQGNQKKCMSCHIGYGWEDANFDFANQENVDCLACHADVNLYGKSDYGYPAAGIDLAAAAQSVRNPTRENCGGCHFDGGGGNGVKHGDLDEHLYFPEATLDVHMGELDFQCTDCHQTKDHQILGRLVVDNYTIDPQEQVACTDCHASDLHADDRINAHTQTVACQTCHIPDIGVKDPTKVYWDWSTAGQDLPENHFTYLKIKGSFVYESDFAPAYSWFNGNLEYRYLLGDKIDPTQPTILDQPAGSITDPNAKIYPFKIHVARQPYDTVNNYLLQPLTAREDGFWTTFDWPSALQLGSDIVGMDFSGEYDFAETWMYWPVTHMVPPSEKALTCNFCHGPEGRMDWQALGYLGDPIDWGGRNLENNE
ncbi:MAG TPA: cytochrome C [Chloroflexi bacterium]|nr:cytochrome C [Chloroflexota bacterium]